MRREGIKKEEEEERRRQGAGSVFRMRFCGGLRGQDGRTTETQSLTINNMELHLENTPGS